MKEDTQDRAGGRRGAHFLFICLSTYRFLHVCTCHAEVPWLVPLEGSNSIPYLSAPANIKGRHVLQVITIQHLSVGLFGIRNLNLASCIITNFHRVTR